MAVGRSGLTAGGRSGSMAVATSGSMAVATIGGTRREEAPSSTATVAA